MPSKMERSCLPEKYYKYLEGGLSSKHDIRVRYSVGVIPLFLTNVLIKWLAVKYPMDEAISFTGRLVSASNCAARSILKFVT